MGLKKFLAAYVAALILLPAAASALTLSESAKQQVSGLALQLVGIMTALQQAQAQGSAYTSSPVFQAQAAAWSTQITQIGQQFVSILSSAVSTTQTPTSIPTMGGSTSSCPDFTRNLSLGMQGGDVAQLQLFLAYDRYGKFLEGVNGYFDQATQDAVERYQSGYGIVSGGSPSTTGFGVVGPGTRASINASCARGSYVISVPPITVPATGNNGIVSPTPTPSPVPSPTPTPTPAPTPPPAVSYSTGELTLVSNLTGNNGPTSVGFKVNMLPNTACSAATYTLSFGDGQQQNLIPGGSCSNQIQIITHVYPQTGQYTATLTSGSFSTTLVVNVQGANNSISLSAARDASTARLGHITAKYDPGVTCAAGSYTLTFGDGTSQNLSFDATSCIVQTKIIDHTFPQTVPYLISASDSSGHTVAVQFTPVAP